MAYLAEETAGQDVQELPDRVTAERLRHELAQAREAHEMFLKQEHAARERADALGRVVKGLSVALDVIDPSEKPMSAETASIRADLDTTRYHNG